MADKPQEVQLRDDAPIAMDEHQILTLNILPTEQWRWVIGYEDLYSVSNFGRIFSCYRRTCLTPSVNNGYLRVSLSKDGKITVFLVHRLVALAFIENTSPETAIFVNHKDGNRVNNYAMNLEWVSPSENSKHAHDTLSTKISSRPVIQYTLDGVYINRFNSAIEAVRSLDIKTLHATHISKVCKGENKSAGGFRWEYETILEAPTNLTDGREIPGFSMYLAFPEGKIYSKFQERYLVNQKSKNGYMFVFLRNDGFQQMMLVHRAIALAFIPNPENKPEVNHINAKRDDNRVENLEWSTRAENMDHIGEIGNSHSKPVIQVTETGEIIARFPSIKEAARSTGISTDSIARRCYGNSAPIKEKYFKFA